MKRALLFLISFAAFLCVSAFAHEVRPAYLEIRQTGAETYDVLWKVSGSGEDLRLALYVELPADCNNVTEPRGVMINNALTERWSVQRAGGLDGGTIHIARLSATMTDVLVRLECLDGTAQVTRLTPSAPSFVVEAAPRAIEVAGTYLSRAQRRTYSRWRRPLAVRVALLILVKGTRPLIWTVTAFTVAHSLTLAGATLGFVHVPGPPVEAAIALSIVFVTAEIVHSREGNAGLTERFPWVVAFTFGLLHGFGFASALSEVGLPQSAIPVALLLFNLGVEIGQLLFIAGVFHRHCARQAGHAAHPDVARSVSLAHSSVCHRHCRRVLGNPAYRCILKRGQPLIAKAWTAPLPSAPSPLACRPAATTTPFAIRVRARTQLHHAAARHIAACTDARRPSNGHLPANPRHV